jgi:hypothetical protein
MMLRQRLFSIIVVAIALAPCSSLSLSSYSRFHGTPLQTDVPSPTTPTTGAASLSMRKQKASDRRTRRMQRGGEELAQDLIRENLRSTITSSPMSVVGQWNYKGNGVQPRPEKTGGRGRSRKRGTLYNSLSSYHNNFLTLLTAEYQAEVRVIVRFFFEHGAGKLKIRVYRNSRIFTNTAMRRLFFHPNL